MKKKRKYQQYLKKADFVLLAVLCLVGILMIVIPVAGRAGTAEEADSAGTESTEETGPQVVVYVGSGVYGTYPLNVDKTVRITQLGDGVSDTMTNVIEIQNGSVRMESSTCRNQICVDESWISSKGEMIVCLPNKVIVMIEEPSQDASEGATDSSTEDGVDAIAQ